MKKVSIIILLTALILGAFTACNGDVFSDLMPEPEPTPKRTITLEIPEDEYWANVSFDSSSAVKTKVLEIPEDCEKWADYLTKVTDVKVYNNGTPLTLNKEYYDGVYFGVHVYGILLDDTKVAPPDTVLVDNEIVIGGTYILNKDSSWD